MVEARIEISPDVKALFVAVAAIVALSIMGVVALDKSFLELAMVCLVGILAIAGIKLGIELKNGRNGNGGK